LLFLLVSYVIFPVDKFQVGSFNVFLQQFGPFDCRLDLDVSLFLLDLFLKPSQFGLQNLILRFKLIDFFELGLILVVLLTLVIDGEGVVGFGSVIEGCCSRGLELHPQLSVYLLELGYCILLIDCIE
jgi:hypothetical protein